MLKLSAEDQRLIGSLLKPSWLSALVAIVAGVIISAGVIITFELNTSALQQQLISWQQNQPQPTLTQPGQTLPESDHPTLRGTWPLLLLWSAVGLLVYALVATIMRGLGRAEELRESLEYVNARPRAALVQTAEHLLLRAIAAVVLALFAIFFVRQVLPYGITASHASAADFWSVDGILYALLSFALTALCLHILTILLRLSLGRVRVFPSGLPE